MDFKEFFYKKHPSERDRIAIQKYQQGIPVTEILQELGYTSVGKFYEMLKQQGLTANRQKQSYDLIDYFHNGGYNSSQIANLVNMSERRVRDVIKSLRG
jgi:predicted transcriptional regulator